MPVAGRPEAPDPARLSPRCDVDQLDVEQPHVGGDAGKQSVTVVNALGFANNVRRRVVRSQLAFHQFAHLRIKKL